MNQPGHSALILGASGLVGSHLTRLLLSDQNFDVVTILVRKKLDLDHPKLMQVFLTEELSLIKADHVFCCIGTTMKKAGSKEDFRAIDLELPLKIAKMAKDNGTKVFCLVSAMGATEKSVFFYNKIKGETERLIKEIGFQNYGIFRPSLILGERKESRSGETFAKIVMGILKPLTPLKYQGIQAETIAEAMRQFALSPTHFKIFQSDEIQKAAKLTN